MKKIITFFAVLFIIAAAHVNAQWTEVNNNIGSKTITSMFAFGEDLMVGTMGGGIFKSSDYGDSWIDVSGDITSKNVNDIRGGAGPQVVWAATDNGLFFTQDHTSYIDGTSNITNKDINYFWFGDSDFNGTKWAVGTNGDGVYVSDELTGPWVQRNTGLTGDALVVNDMSGYEDDDDHYSVIGTDGGVFFSIDSLNTWVAANGSLTGDALKVNRLFGFSTVVLSATDGGYYLTTDLGVNWIEGIVGEKFNQIGIAAFGTPSSFYFLGGTNAYFSLDLQTWNSMDLTGVTGGAITSFATTSQYFYVGTETGGVFRKALANVTGIKQISETIPDNFKLHQNYPNPFNPTTTINFDIPQTGNVKLSIYNSLGEKVKDLVSEIKSAGSYSVSFDASNLTSGIYFYKIEMEAFTSIKKMILVK
ncbi:MAG: T9SS type A sorting domain-containing protein [Melioribacteraceae bacterium]|nr:T9SS type A sorting domain-containing protein [Melioribacteraceae bacterium]MCF8264094.1 T9SS type A sorting domain-containing protein [Melioribacteraceae bacterium]MCF8413142.1 T9SS type A sorting domain-containing protein [Melioribacteraceae bacterium]MCF8432658.1 T9SS type A sorting domain-containing protein [Melioribacteraceae bacterium]